MNPRILQFKRGRHLLHCSLIIISIFPSLAKSTTPLFARPTLIVRPSPLHFVPWALTIPRNTQLSFEGGRRPPPQPSLIYPRQKIARSPACTKSSMDLLVSQRREDTKDLKCGTHMSLNWANDCVSHKMNCLFCSTLKRDFRPSPTYFTCQWSRKLLLTKQHWEGGRNIYEDRCAICVVHLLENDLRKALSLSLSVSC